MFGDVAYDCLTETLLDEGLELLQGRRFRLINSKHELEEARQAQQLLNEDGFSCEIKHKKPPSENLLAVQDDGNRAGWVDPIALMTHLQELIEVTRLETAATAIEQDRCGTKVHLHNLSLIQGEIVALTRNMGIPKLLPELTGAFVPVLDQWIRLPRRKSTATPWTASGNVFSMSHGYLWGCFLDQHIHLGGGRHLRPLAGVEATSATVEHKISRFLQKNFCEAFSEEIVSAPSPISAFAGIDNKPADELPIVGPMFNNPRLVLGSGFFGAGLTQGFLAGKCLAELILQGNTPNLPREFWPERLRKF